MRIRQDDPTARCVADLLAHHLRELQGAMAGHAFALDASGHRRAGFASCDAFADYRPSPHNQFFQLALSGAAT